MWGGPVADIQSQYIAHATAFEPMPAGDPFGDMMNAPRKYAVSPTLEKPIWRNTAIIRADPIDAVRKLEAEPGKKIVLDGSSQLLHALPEHALVDELHLTKYPLTLGDGKRVWPEGLNATFRLVGATPYPTGVVGLQYERERRAPGA